MVDVNFFLYMIFHLIRIIWLLSLFFFLLILSQPKCRWKQIARKWLEMPLDTLNRIWTQSDFVSSFFRYKLRVIHQVYGLALVEGRSHFHSHPLLLQWQPPWTESEWRKRCPVELGLNCRFSNGAKSLSILGGHQTQKRCRSTPNPEKNIDKLSFNMYRISQQSLTNRIHPYKMSDGMGRWFS